MLWVHVRHSIVFFAFTCEFLEPPFLENHCSWPCKWSHWRTCCILVFVWMTQRCDYNLHNTPDAIHVHGCTWVQPRWPNWNRMEWGILGICISNHSCITSKLREPQTTQKNPTLIQLLYTTLHTTMNVYNCLNFIPALWCRLYQSYRMVLEMHREEGWDWRGGGGGRGGGRVNLNDTARVQTWVHSSMSPVQKLSQIAWLTELIM